MHTHNLFNQEYRQPILLFNFYRVVLSTILAFMFFYGLNPSESKGIELGLFKWSLLAYIGFVVLTIYLHFIDVFSEKNIFFLFLLDLVILSFIMKASGGIDSGFGPLIIINLAAASIIVSMRNAMLLASIACSLVVYWEIFTDFHVQSNQKDFFEAAFIGIGCFITSLLMQYIVSKVKTTQKIAEQHRSLVIDLTQLNEQIVHRMRTGIVVCDQQGNVHTSNTAARNLLNNTQQQALNQLPNELLIRLNQWLQAPQAQTLIFKDLSNLPDLQVNFCLLNEDNHANILVFIEDLSKTTQQAQQLKLASLGQFTAAIAHEVRNPLGAISHAGQLLSESKHLDDGDLRLLQIIHTHCNRVNDIIENVLQLSKRQQSQAKLLPLQQFVHQVCQDVSEFQFKHLDLQIHIDIDANMQIRVDRSQMQQVLFNLIENGLRYSQQHKQIAQLSIIGGMSNQNTQPYIDIIYVGPGIDPVIQDRIFEPFFTTDNSGTGLGLYICKELCECNQARLETISPYVGGCFRITFSHPQRLGNEPDYE